tara:strand:- start:9047 stop:10300 length:1254 start_codon:yes stop_codon:yes gene_type:complete
MLFLILSLSLFLVSLKAVGVRIYNFSNVVVSVFWGVVVFVLLAIPVDWLFYHGRYSHLYNYVVLHVSFFVFGVSSGLILFSRYSESVQQASVWSVSSNTAKAYFFLLLFGVGLMALLYLRMPEVPLFSEDVHEARVRSLRGLGYNYKLALSSMYVGFVGVSYFLFQKGKRSVAIFLSLLLFLFSMPTANRIDSLFFILFVVLVALLPIKGARSSVYNLIRAFFVVSGIFFIAGVFQFSRHYGLNSLFDSGMEEIYRFALGGFFHRFWVQLENISFLIDNEVALPWYETVFNDIAMAIPGSGVGNTSGVLLKEAANVRFAGGGITPSFIGEGYVSFGCIGSFIYTAILGIFFGFINILLLVSMGGRHKFFPFLLVGSVSIYGVATSTLGAVLVHNILPLVIVFFAFLFICCFLKRFKR